jgi:hypothetical protein
MRAWGILSIFGENVSYAGVIYEKRIVMTKWYVSFELNPL